MTITNFIEAAKFHFFFKRLFCDSKDQKHEITLLRLDGTITS